MATNNRSNECEIRTQPHDEEKDIEGYPHAVGVSCSPTEELLKLFFKNKKNEGFVFQQLQQHNPTTIPRKTTHCAARETYSPRNFE